MSLTLRKVPQELQPTYNEVLIVATSSLQTQYNYQLVTELWCRGTRVSTLKTPVNPEGYIAVDLHKHLEGRVSFDFNPGLTGINPATNSFATYSVVFKDEFRHIWDFVDNAYSPIGGTAFVGFVSRDQPYFSVGDYIYVSQDAGYTHASYNGVHQILQITQSGLTWSVVVNEDWAGSSPVNPGSMTYRNSALTTLPVGSITLLEGGTSSIITQFPEKYVFNGVESFLDFIDWDYRDWEAGTASLGKFFTNAPDYYELDVDGRMFLNMYQNANSEIGSVKVKIDGVTRSMTNGFTTITNDQWRFLQVDVSPKTLTGFGWITTQSQLMEIWAENTSGVKTIASKFFKISDRCSKYDKMQIIFLDKMGSFIPYTFNKVNKENRTISRTNFQQFYGKYPRAINNWAYDTWSRGQRTLDVVVVENWTVNSDWVDQKTGDYLMELFETPEAYLVKPDGVIVAINVTVQNGERKQIINEQVINYTLTFELSNKNASQR